MLFGGSLRMNVDPSDVKTDGEIWQALEQSHLKQFVSQIPSQLDFNVGEGGEALRYDIKRNHKKLYSQYSRFSPLCTCIGHICVWRSSKAASHLLNFENKTT